MMGISLAIRIVGVAHYLSDAFGGTARSIVVHAVRIALAVLVLTACVSRSRTAPVPPPAYPYPGFGRIGCYAGPSLTRMASSDSLPTDVTTRGPWLIIDSVSRAELRAAGYTTGDIRPSDFSPAFLLERADTLASTFGSWHRVLPDSIVFDEGAFPPVTWRFRVVADGLVGEGVLVHDIVVTEVDPVTKQRVSRNPVSRWKVRLRRVACTDIPHR